MHTKEIILISILVLILILLFGYFIHRFLRRKKETLKVVTKNTTIEEKGGEIKESINDNIEDDASSKTRYNYSLEAHLNLAPKESLDRYLDIKSYLLSYPNIQISNSWKYERFKYGARTLAKITVQGKTLTIYFDLDPALLVDTVYNFVDESNKVNHQLTPVMFKVRGNRGVKHAKELIDLYFVNFDVTKNEVVPISSENYNMTKEQLLAKDLIKEVKIK